MNEKPKLIVDPYRVRNEGGLAGMRCSKEKTEDRLVGVTRSGREAKGEKVSLDKC